MSSSTVASSPSVKTSNAPSQSTSPAYSHPGAANTSIPGGVQRRTGGSGSFGAGSTSRHSPTARNSQPLRKQHKAQRRARLADEDAIAESVSLSFSLCTFHPAFRWVPCSSLSKGRHEVHQQPQRANLHHASHELFTASTTLLSTA